MLELRRCGEFSVSFWYSLAYFAHLFDVLFVYRTVELARLLEDACRWLGMPLQEATWETVAAEVRTAHPALYEACWRAAFEKAAKAEEKKQQHKRPSTQASQPQDASQQSAQTPADLANTAGSPSKKTRTPTGATPGPSQEQSQQLEPRTLRFDAADDTTPSAPPPQQQPHLPPPDTPLSSLKFEVRVRVIEELFIDLARQLGGQGEAQLAAKAVRHGAENAADTKRAEIVSELRNFINKAKSRGNAPGQYAGLYAAVFEAYQANLKAASEVDFDDMLILMHKALTDPPGCSDPQPGSDHKRENLILKDMRSRHRYILVDEYQDLNELQVAVTVALVGPAGRLTAVGDEVQSIYGFRGAEAWTLDCINEIHAPLNPNLKKHLTINYRSRQHILNAAKAVLGRHGKELTAACGEAGEPVTIVEAPTCVEEAVWIRRRIQELAAAGVPYREMAILFRCRRSAGVPSLYAPLKAELDSAGVPNKLLAERTLLDRVVVKDLRAYLTLTINPDDDDFFLQVANRPRRGFGAAAVAKLQAAQAASPLRLSLYDTAVALCAPGAEGDSGLLPSQLAGLRSFLKTLQMLRRESLSRDPVEFIAFLLRRRGYVKWAESERARKKKKKAADDEEEEYHEDDEMALDGSGSEAESDDEEMAVAAAAEDSSGAKEVDEEEEEEETDYSGLDPLTPYDLDLSAFRAATGPLRRVLRQAALFTASYPVADFPSSIGEHLGPPPLLELAWKAAARTALSLSKLQELQEDDVKHEMAARVRLGPRVLQDFVSHVWEETEGRGSTLDEDNVVLSTIHGAKGLEWDAVFVLRCNDGCMPTGPWNDDRYPNPGPRERPLLPGYNPPVIADPDRAHYEEERRLAHVVMTRARRYLHLTMVRYAATIGKFGPGYKMENPTRFLENLVADCHGPERGNGLQLLRLPENANERKAANRPYRPQWAQLFNHPHPIWAAAETPEGREMIRREVADAE